MEVTKSMHDHAKLLRLHGALTHTCKGCLHLRRTPGTSGTYYKCDLAQLSRGSGTDWRVGWQACGRYEVEPKDIPLLTGGA